MGKFLKSAFLVIAVCSMALFLTACSQKTPGAVTSNALNAVKIGDLGTVAECCSDDLTICLPTNISDQKARIALGELVTGDGARLVSSLASDQQLALLEYCAKVLDYDFEVVDERIDGDAASVTVTFRAHDCATPARQALLSPSSDSDDFAKRFYSSLAAETVSIGERTQEFTGTVTLTKTDGTWRISAVDDGVWDGLTGGLFSCLKPIGTGSQEIPIDLHDGTGNFIAFAVVTTIRFFTFEKTIAWAVGLRSWGWVVVETCLLAFAVIVAAYMLFRLTKALLGRDVYFNYRTYQKQWEAGNVDAKCTVPLAYEPKRTLASIVVRWIIPPAAFCAALALFAAFVFFVLWAYSLSPFQGTMTDPVADFLVNKMVVPLGAVALVIVTVALCVVAVFFAVRSALHLFVSSPAFEKYCAFSSRGRIKRGARAFHGTKDI